MAAVTAAVVAAGATAYAANRQSAAARDARDSQGRAMDQQTAMDRERLDFSREQYNDWRTRWDPIMDDLTGLAYEQREPDYTAIQADVNAAFDTSQAANRRQMQRFGLQPSDGQVHDSEMRYGLGRAMASVNARNQARTSMADQQFQRLSALYSIGQGQGAAAANMINAAYAGASGTFGQHAGMYGNQSINHQNQANQLWGDAAGFAGYGMQTWANGRGGG